MQRGRVRQSLARLNAVHGIKLRRGTVDVQMKNVNGKEDTAFTVQYDLCMAKRFNLTYTGEDGKEHPVFVVHRSSIGSIERTVAFLIEHYGGAFPLWLAPVQVKVLPVSEKFTLYARKVHEAFLAAEIRSELDDSNETLGKKVRAAKLQKVPYWIVVGEKEQKEKTITLESRNGSKEVLLCKSVSQRLAKEIGMKSS